MCKKGEVIGCFEKKSVMEISDKIFLFVKSLIQPKANRKLQNYPNRGLLF